MPVPENKTQISITLPNEVIEWAEKEASKIFKKRSGFISDIVINAYLENTRKIK